MSDPVSAASVPPLSNIRIVLVGTLYSGNIGSICRAMENMGLTDLALAAPNIKDDGTDASRMAVHAVSLLAKAKTFPSLDEAVADCCAVVGTTARRGLYRQHVKTPREIAPSLLELAGQGKVALVFGREDKGLTNEEIMRCTHLISIPVDPLYRSMNLSQAVVVCAYELYTALGSYRPPAEKSKPACAAEKHALMEKWRHMLLTIGFMDEAKADHMMQGVQRIFSRGTVTQDDVSIMMGVARQALWASGHPEAHENGVVQKPQEQAKRD